MPGIRFSRLVLSLAVASFVVGAGGCQRQKEKRALDRFVEETIRQLDAFESARPVRRVGDKIELSGIGVTILTMVSTVPGESRVHIHTVAESTEGERFDLCLNGADEAEAVKLLVNHALPPVASLLKKEPMLGATRFSSADTTGVPGRAGFAGPIYVQGAEGAIEVSGGVFQSPPAIAENEKPHLAKAMLVSEGGQWLRTLELDGSAVEEHRKLDAPAPKESVSLVQFAIVGGTADSANAQPGKLEQAQAE